MVEGSRLHTTHGGSGRAGADAGPLAGPFVQLRSGGRSFRWGDRARPGGSGRAGSGSGARSRRVGPGWARSGPGQGCVRAVGDGKPRPHRCRGPVRHRAGLAGLVGEAEVALGPPPAEPLVGSGPEYAHLGHHMRDRSPTRSTKVRLPWPSNGRYGGIEKRWHITLGGDPPVSRVSQLGFGKDCKRNRITPILVGYVGHRPRQGLRQWAWMIGS